MSTRPFSASDQRGLRPVHHKACSALRRARLEESRNDVVAARADRKDCSDRDIVFEIGGSIERIDRNTERRSGVENLRQFRFLGQHGRNRRGAERVAHHLVGGNVDILLQIAVGIDPAKPPGNASQRPIGDKVGKADRRHRERLDHGGDRGTVRRILHRAIEMRTQGHAFVHGRSPVSTLSGAFQNFLPVGNPRRITSQFAKLGKFSYLWLKQSFPYKGWC